ncbi:hypothetical protein MRX96_027172 [Rhipicephalus microplus]
MSSGCRPAAVTQARFATLDCRGRVRAPAEKDATRPPGALCTTEFEEGERTLEGNELTKERRNEKTGRCQARGSPTSRAVN